MSRISAAACAAALTFGIAALPAAAHADAGAVDDGTGDVWTQQYDPETDEMTWVLVEGTDNVDLTRTVVKHTNKRIAVTATFADLVKDSEYAAGYSLRMVLNDGRKAWFSINEDGDEPWTWLTVQFKAGGAYDKHLECPGVRAAFDWDADIVTGSFPRSCFGDPKWLKFHGDAVTDTSGDNVWLWDNAHNGDPVDWNDLKPWSSRIKAG